MQRFKGVGSALQMLPIQIFLLNGMLLFICFHMYQAQLELLGITREQHSFRTTLSNFVSKAAHHTHAESVPKGTLQNQAELAEQILSKQQHMLLEQATILSSLRAAQDLLNQLTRARLDSKQIVLTNLFLGDSTLLCHVEDLKLWMFLDSRDVGIVPHLCNGKGWEPTITKVLRRTIKAGWNVVDAGANFGWYTGVFAELVGPTGRVLSVEANPRTFDLLSRTYEVAGYDKTVLVVNRALLNEDGQIVSIKEERTRALNNAVKVGKLANSTGFAPVKTVTLDTLVQRQKWTKVDFMKIDVEGVEDRVWEGCQGVIADNPDIIICMEVNTARMLHKQRDPETFYRAINSAFPKLRHIDDENGIQETTVEEMLKHLDGDMFLYLKNA